MIASLKNMRFAGAMLTALSALYSPFMCNAEEQSEAWTVCSENFYYRILGVDPKVKQVSSAGIRAELPVSQELNSFRRFLIDSAGLTACDDGTILYTPDADYAIIDKSEYDALLKEGASGYTVDVTIDKVADTQEYACMKMASVTRSAGLSGDGMDYATVEYINYSKTDNAIIDYFDVFNANAERRLREMMYPLAAKKYHLTLESSDEMEIVPNFAITPQGVTFSFPESSIAPASDGCPEISLTWQQLRDSRTLADGAGRFSGAK